MEYKQGAAWYWYPITSIVIIGLMFFAINYLLPNQPMNGQGDCGTGYIAKDGSAPFEYSGDQNVCKVMVKAGSQGQGEACYGFKYPPANQSDGCYNVSGLGSSSVSVGGGGTSPECKEISHVEFYACEETNTPTSPPPATSTETSTPEEATETPTQTATSTDTDVPTVTATTPFKFWTPTPLTPTPPETATYTPTASTFTPTFEITPPDTLPPPPKKKTGTPALLLPDTGFDGSEANAEEPWYAPAVFLLALGAFFLLMRWRRR